MATFIRELVFLVFIFGAMTSELYAAVVPAESCSKDAVQAAIGAANNGDTVTVPSGNCAWSSAISLNKSLSIIGAGSSKTVIAGYAFNVTDGTDNWRISGFTFTDNGRVVVPFTAGSTRSSNGCRNFRIDRCKFIGYIHWIEVDGHSTGVIDHNHFEGNSSTGIYIFGDDEPAWTRDTNLGEDDFVFIEDNTFDTTKPEDSAHFILSSWGGRMVIRYNSFLESGSSWSSAQIDTHGY